MLSRRPFTLLAAIASLAFSLLVGAPAAAADYKPDILTLKGDGDGLNFPPDAGLNLADGGTIEFWVRPGWTKDPGYDPVILSNAGPDGASFLIYMLRDRNGIGMVAGDKFDVAPFDFTDGKLHFVTISDIGGATAVSIDSQPILLWLFGYAQRRSSGFFIGTADGETAPFSGMIAGLRIWNTVVAPDTLAKFARSALMDPDRSPHPDFPNLVGMSLFEQRTLALAQPQPLPAEPSGSEVPK